MSYGSSHGSKGAFERAGSLNLAALPRLRIEPDQRQGLQILLTVEQRHYLERVLRLQLGDPVLAFDGSGVLWLGQFQIQGIEGLEPLPDQGRELPFLLHVAIGIPKQGFDEVVHQLTELGATTITPLLTERTLVQPGSTKMQRWRRIVQEAAEQCERIQLPQVRNPLPFSVWMKEQRDGALLILEARQTALPLGEVLNTLSIKTEISLGSGPEGGWSPAELEKLQAHNAQMCSLGPRILRAVTAPVVAAGVITAWLDTRER